MTTRDASVHWTGTVTEGSGQLTLDSSNMRPYAVSWPTRSGDPDGQTSPEELIAGPCPVPGDEPGGRAGR